MCKALCILQREDTFTTEYIIIIIIHRRLSQRKGLIPNESLSEPFGSRWANEVKINA